MHGNRAKRGIVIGFAVIAVAAGGIFWLYDFRTLPAPDDEPVFAGNSGELQATQVVPTLDTPIPQGKNAVWCASFLAAWKTLETDLAKEPISLAGDPQVAQSLNKAADPRPHIPKKSLYTAAGWNDKGITDQIRNDLAQEFPGKAPPDFPGIARNSFVAYGYLEANVKFAIPYFQNREPLEFTDTTGKVTLLNSFGIRQKDSDTFFELRRQPKILFFTWEYSISGDHQLSECIVDLDHTSHPNQIILALVNRKPTLKEMLISVGDKIKNSTKLKRDGVGARDVLLVPDTVWRITHNFTGLEGHEFTNSKLKGQRIDVARQDIKFRLDRNGAELKSETKTYYGCGPQYYLFNRPFLLYMKKRGAEMPYFVMWVENAELLNKWSGKSIETDETHE